MRLAKALVVVAVATGTTAGSASAAVQDPDRNATSSTGWHWYRGVSASFLKDKIEAKGERLVSLQVESSSPLRFTAALVKNKGKYKRGWYWFYGLSANGLKSEVETRGARIVDIERYVSGGEQRFAAVLVKNKGEAAKSWWWYFGLTGKQVKDRLEENKARLIDVDSWGTGSSRRFAVVMIRNKGVDSRAWWWYINATPSFISSKVKENKARLIDIDSAGSGRFNVVMVRNTGSASRFWIYAFGGASRLTDLALQNASRIVDAKTYVSGGQKRYVAIAIENAPNADTRKLRKTMRAGWGAGLFGAHLKQVGGKVLVGIHRNRIFEPASSLKVLPHLYTIHQVETDPEGTSLDGSIRYRTCPGSPGRFDSGMCEGQSNAKDICPTDPDATDAYTTTIGTALQWMMEDSDNRLTRSVVDRDGQAAINAYADGEGIGADTQIRQVFGCGFDNGLRNDWTLADAGRLYEGVLNGSLIEQEANRTTFFDLMNTGGAGSGLQTAIQEEAQDQKKSSAVADFTAGVTASEKGGSYNVPCPAGSPSDCVFGYYRSRAGRITLPYRVGPKGAKTTVFRSFVFGYFVNDLAIPCSSSQSCTEIIAADSTFGAMFVATLRPAIRAALKTW